VTGEEEHIAHTMLATEEDEEEEEEPVHEVVEVPTQAADVVAALWIKLPQENLTKKLMLRILQQSPTQLQRPILNGQSIWRATKESRESRHQRRVLKPVKPVVLLLSL